MDNGSSLPKETELAQRVLLLRALQMRQRLGEQQRFGNTSEMVASGERSMLVIAKSTFRKIRIPNRKRRSWVPRSCGNSSKR
eukprot:10985203-Karenia_brevis.AAC.1